MPLKDLIIISGIFGKGDELELLPPPPPFPDIGIDNEPENAAGAWKVGKQKRRGRSKIPDSKREAHGLTSDAEAMAEFPAPEGKEHFFMKLFRKKDEELGKELEELEEMPMPKEPKFIAEKLPKLKTQNLGAKAPKRMAAKTMPIMHAPGIKLPELRTDEELKPVNMGEAEEEIRKSIESVQGKKKPSLGRFFGRKEKEVREKIETPEIMPRTFDKIDHVQEIEERIHKARLLLMDFRFGDAKRVYVEIMRAYNELEAKDRSKVYDDIRDLYYERKGAEKFAKV